MNRSFTLILSAAALTTSMPAPLSAQTQERYERGNDQQIGTRFKRQRELQSVTDTRRMQKEVARCVVYRNKDLSRTLLAKSDTFGIDFYQIDELSSDEMFKELDVGDCLSRAAKRGTLSIRMSIPFRTLRNLMAEEVYLMDQKGPLVFSADAPVSLENRHYAVGRHPGAIATAKLSDCLTHKAPVVGHDLLNSLPGSDEEGEAIDALLPGMIECAGPEVAAAEIDISMLRIVMADGLWARMHYGPTATAANGDDEPKDDDA